MCVKVCLEVFFTFSFSISPLFCTPVCFAEGKLRFPPPIIVGFPHLSFFPPIWSLSLSVWHQHVGVERLLCQNVSTVRFHRYQWSYTLVRLVRNVKLWFDTEAESKAASAKYTLCLDIKLPVFLCRLVQIHVECFYIVIVYLFPN